MAASKLSSFHLDSVVVEQDALEVIATEFMAHTAKDMDPSAAASFQEKCGALIEKGQLEQLVEAFTTSLEQVGPVSSAKDLQSRFSILFSLMRHLPAAVLTKVVPTASGVVKSLAPKTGMDPEQDARMRIGIIRNLYTVIDLRSPTRYGLLLDMISLARKYKTYDILDGTTAADIEELCSLFVEPGSIEPRRELYRQFSDLSSEKIVSLGAELGEDQLRADELKQYRFLVKLLETYEDDATNIAQAIPFAARAVTIAIKYPLPGDMAISTTLEEHSLEGLKRAAVAVIAVEQSQKVDWASIIATTSAIAHYKAAKALSSDPKYAKLYRLFEIFAGEELESFLKFQTENKGAFAEFGLDEETCLLNIRYLTLASLAANAETIPYTTIADKLKVNLEDVEKWIIDGCTCKVIDAKMDQTNESIVINRGSQRLLTDEHWIEVQSKLSQWKHNVHDLLSTIKAVRQEHHLLQQQQ